MVRRSLAAKLTIAMLGVAVASLVSSLAMSVFVLRDAAATTSQGAQDIASDAIGDAIRREGEAMSSALAEDARNPVAAYDFNRLKDIAKNLMDSEEVRSVLIVGPGGHVMGDGTDRPALARTASSEPRPDDDYVVQERGDELRFARRIEAGGRELGFVVLGLSLTAREEARRELASTVARDTARGQLTLLRSSLVATAVLALLTALAAAILGRRLARPVVELSRASALVARGDLSTRVTPRSDDEIGQLSLAFNEMTAELAVAREAEREQERMKRELEIAAQLQLSLVPSAPRHDELEIAGALKPADEVGGDFYDVLTKDSALWITIGDVTGHGIEAGIIMLMAQTCFATLFEEDPNAGVADAFSRANRLLQIQIAERLRSDKYITAQLIAYRGAGRFELAGSHEWPIIVRAQTRKTEVVECSGPWLGIFPELASVPVGTIELSEGDVLCLYSDGLIETASASGELFDMDRLAETVRDAVLDNRPLAPAVDEVLAAIAAFGPRQDDDRTLLLLRYSGRKA